MCLMNFPSYLRPASGYIIFHIVTLRAEKKDVKNYNNYLTEFRLNHYDQSFIDILANGNDIFHFNSIKNI